MSSDRPRCHLKESLCPSSSRRVVFGWGIGGAYTPPKTNMEPNTTQFLRSMFGFGGVPYKDDVGWNVSSHDLNLCDSVSLFACPEANSSPATSKTSEGHKFAQQVRPILIPTVASGEFCKRRGRLIHAMMWGISWNHNKNNLRTCLICPLTTVARKWPRPVLAVLA